MMQNPQILAALQERLDGLVGTSTGYIERYSILQYEQSALSGSLAFGAVLSVAFIVISHCAAQIEGRPT